MSKARNLLSIIAVFAAVALAVGCGGPEDASSAGTTLSAEANGSGGSGDGELKELDDGEAAHLIFMREEEKLARDVYLTFAGWYPDYQVFSNIATQSEQTHTDTVAEKLLAYGLEDPNPDTNNLPDAIGVFTGAEYGPYFTEKFTQLTELGSQGVLEALYVGALIEELDMDDIINCPKEIVAQDNGIAEGECGMLHTDNPDIEKLYGNILDGSKSHLRAYVKNIETFIGEGNYEAQYITQEEVDEILGR